ncbi:MAG: hypothetical protein ACYDHZ_09675 [Dehalococcoidia bacterium]
MEKENTTKTAGEGNEGLRWEGCQCGCGGTPVKEEKANTFGGACGCKPEEMSKMWKDCCGNMAIPEAMKEKMKGFYQGKSQKA